MKKLTAYLLAGIFLLLLSCQQNESNKKAPWEPLPEAGIQLDSTILGVTTIASGLDVPWDIAFGADGNIWVAEQSGTISRISLETGVKKQLLSIPDVWRERTAGLLGMELHPDWEKHPWVFVDYTFRRDSLSFSKLVRYTYKNDTLSEPLILMEIPGTSSHHGSRMRIGADGKLYWATGDAHQYKNAQDTTAPNGKILRLETDGSVPADNPIKGSYVWAWGFRNMQGLVFSPKQQLYTSEHGEASDDEVNLIRPLGNYGWPNIEGYHETPAEAAFQEKYNTVPPIKAWTPTIAPAGLDFYAGRQIPEWHNSLLLTTLKAQSLRVLKLNADGTAIAGEKIFLSGKYGRLRDVCVSPAGDVYIATSNRDWNPSKGFPTPKDDRILKLSKAAKAITPLWKEDVPASQAAAGNGAALYNQYCASCHKEDGTGVPGTFPALAGSSKVKGGSNALIKTLLNGTNGKLQMPSFHFMKDEEIASVLNYIRTAWGNDEKSITPEEITKQRTKN